MRWLHFDHRRSLLGDSFGISSWHRVDTDLPQVTDVLVVCAYGKQRQTKALFPGARVITPLSTLLGHRFDEIIVLPNVVEGCSFCERQMAERWLAEELPLKLKPGGKMHMAPDIDFD